MRWKFKLKQEDFVEFANLTNKASEMLVQLLGKDENDPKAKRGGVLILANDYPSQVQVRHAHNIGSRLEQDNYITSMHNACHRVSQLLNNQEHISSYQSRGGQEFWGGAIRIPNLDLIISVFGFSELGDEAIVLCSALKMGWIDKKYALKVIDFSANHLFDPLQEALALDKVK